VRGRPSPGQKPVARKWLDSSVHWYWKDKPLQVNEIQLPKAEGGAGALFCLAEGDILKECKQGTFLMSFDREAENR
jgi:hypothetical protein